MPFLVSKPTQTSANYSPTHMYVYRHTYIHLHTIQVIPYFGANPNERKLLRRMWNNPSALGAPDSPFHVLVTNYKLVISDDKHFSRVKWQYMILDEAQAVKNSQSQRWKTLLGFPSRNRCVWVICLVYVCMCVCYFSCVVMYLYVCIWYLMKHKQ
jgi:DNA helicase INO80